MRNGWYAGSVPVSRPMNGSRITAPKIVIMKMPPVLCTHFPTDRPMIDVTTISARMTAVASATNTLLAVIHAAPGPNRVRQIGRALRGRSPR